MEEITRKFSALSPNGDSIDILEYTTVIDITSLEDDSRQYRHGLKKYKTTNGKTLNKINGGYQLLGDDEVYYEK